MAIQRKGSTIASVIRRPRTGLIQFGKLAFNRVGESIIKLISDCITSATLVKDTKMLDSREFLINIWGPPVVLAKMIEEFITI